MSGCLLEIKLLTINLQIDANLDAQYRTAVAGECVTASPLLNILNYDKR